MIFGGDIIEQLIGNGSLDPIDVERANVVRKQTGDTLPITLVRLGIVAEEDLVAAFGEVLGIDRPDPASEPVGADVTGQLNPRFLRRRLAIPLRKPDEQLVIGMADPSDEECLKAMRFALGSAVEPAVIALSTAEALTAQLMADEGLEADLSSGSTVGAEQDVERILEDASDSPVIRLVQTLLTGAASRNASDIHIEPMARHLIVRYRIDGRLVEVDRYPDHYAAPIASRIKVMAGLDIAETRLPQDGRLRLTVKGRQIDVRVSTSPTAWGESLVLRLLGRTAVPLDLDRLGLPPRALEILSRALARPHGIILLTGPTGSGKTTTLYAALARLQRPEVKILTVEDPVEVLMEGVNQVQVRPDIGLDYAQTLRAFLRQDPDILMIGEIRDRETADIAMRAALTGHLVLSTLHTNTALGAFARLSDLGVEAYLTASTVIAAVAQRLVRALCTECREPRRPSVTEERLFEMHDIPVPLTVFEPRGCAHCGQTGYHSRLPLIEIVEVDSDLRNEIRDGTVNPEDQAGSAAHSLRGHGLLLVSQGVTSLEEIERAVQAS
jgi:general secretion pathway protein E